MYILFWVVGIFAHLFEGKLSWCLFWLFPLRCSSSFFFKIFNLTVFIVVRNFLPNWRYFDWYHIICTNFAIWWWGNTSYCVLTTESMNPMPGSLSEAFSCCLFGRLSNRMFYTCSVTSQSDESTPKPLWIIIVLGSCYASAAFSSLFLEWQQESCYRNVLYITHTHSTSSPLTMIRPSSSLSTVKPVCQRSVWPSSNTASLAYFSTLFSV